MATVVLKPAPGLKIRMPERQMRHLSEAGEAVVLNEYWRRRLADGDVVKAAGGRQPAGQPQATSKKKES